MSAANEGNVMANDGVTVRPKVGIPSIAQARFLAGMWGSWTGRVPVNASGGHIDPTVERCALNEWIVPTGSTGKFPNGDAYMDHRLSDAGLEALARYFSKRYGP